MDDLIELLPILIALVAIGFAAGAFVGALFGGAWWMFHLITGV